MLQLLILNAQQDEEHSVEYTPAITIGQISEIFDISQDSLLRITFEGVADVTTDDQNAGYVTETRELMIQKIDHEIISHRDYFDNLDDPSDDGSPLYQKMQAELSLLTEFRDTGYGADLVKGSNLL